MVRTATLLMVFVTSLVACGPPARVLPVDPAAPGGAPPPAGGSFSLRPTGSWSSLPSGTTCAGRVHRSNWEPRPENTVANQTRVDPRAIRRAFAAAPRSIGHAYTARWDTWLLPRVDGAFTGTTDEILQWAACKWGLPDDLLRAIAVRESTWYQDLSFADGTCVPSRGCGDEVDDPAWCRYISGSGHTYPPPCPSTFGIVGVKSISGVDAWPHHSNGTFPFNRDSTAFAADYLGAELRGCYEGWVTWLVQVGAPYESGDLPGCVGLWFAGDWHSPDADEYADRVREAQRERPWLMPTFATAQYACDPVAGCPS
jgi:autotransporter family porin